MCGALGQFRASEKRCERTYARAEFYAQMRARGCATGRTRWLRCAIQRNRSILRICKPVRSARSCNARAFQVSVGRTPMRLPNLVPHTLKDALYELAKRPHRGFTFVRSDGSEKFVPFPTILLEARRRAASLYARGAAKGDRIALIVADSEEFVLTYLGASIAGLVPVPIYPHASFKKVESYHDTVSHIIRASGAQLLVTATALEPFLAPLRVRLPQLKALLLVEELGSGEDTSIDVAVDPADLAFLQFTSGSTASPKGVMVTHANLAWNSQCFIKQGLGRDDSDVGVSWLPLFHDMGLIGFLIGPVFTDIQVCFIPTANFVRAPRVWLDALSRHRGTITYAPNFAYQLVTKRLKERDIGELDLSSVRHAGCGAEPIQPKTLAQFAERLKPAGFRAEAFLPSYGMAEATLAISFADMRGLGESPRGCRVDIIDRAQLEHHQAVAVVSGTPGAVELVNCGRAFPEHELAVVDTATGEKVPDRAVGEVIFRGPSLARGYFDESEKTCEAFRDGWLRTGDLGYLVNGELYICGRIKDMLIIRGRNFYPSDIEAAVGELPRVRRGNVIAFGVQHEGEEALVVCAEAFQSDGEGLKQEVADLVMERFSLSAHAVELVPQGSLPRTSSGKPQRRRAREMYQSSGFPRSTDSDESAT
jgi:fatty-acyl-CoA synthase